MNKIGLTVMTLALILAGGCIKIKHEMKVEPIHVTVEITLKIDRELGNFFGDIDKSVSKDSPKKEVKEGGEK